MNPFYFLIATFSISFCHAMDQDKKNDEIVGLLYQGKMDGVYKLTNKTPKPGHLTEYRNDLRKLRNKIDAADASYCSYLWPVFSVCASVIYLSQDFYYRDQESNKLGGTIALCNIFSSLDFAGRIWDAREQFVLTKQRALQEIDIALGDA